MRQRQKSGKESGRIYLMPTSRKKLLKVNQEPKPQQTLEQMDSM